jgi:hypothetical protein
MRVRLPKPLAGVFGRVNLGRFIPGVIYDVDSDVGAELASWGAEVIPASTPADVIPLPDQQLLTDDQLTGGITVIQPLSVTAEPPLRKRKATKRWPR